MRGNKLFKFLDYSIGIPLLTVLSLFKRSNRKRNLRKVIPNRILVVKFVALGDAILLVPSRSADAASDAVLSVCLVLSAAIAHHGPDGRKGGIPLSQQCSRDTRS